MKRIFVSLFAAAAVLAGVCLGQNTQTQAGGSASAQTSAAASGTGSHAATNASAATSQAANISNDQAQAKSASHLQAGSTVQAELTKPLDAKKNKVGDEVLANTTHDVKSDGKVVVPKGSKLVGHVTQVQAHTKNQATSQLGVAFDRAILKNGTEVPMALTIQAIGRNQSAAGMDDDAMSDGGRGAIAPSGAAPAGGVLGGVRSTAGGAVNSAGNTAGAVTNSASHVGAAGSLTANSQGVVGLSGLSLSIQTTNSSNASVISSQNSTVHLDSGTEMVLRVNQ